MASLDPPNIDSQLMASVIIPSYNGAGKIPGLLEALACQTIMEFEVVLVIDGSTDNTAQVAERYGGRFRRLVVISRENGGRAMARNTGASQATAGLLIFYDDDMVPYSDSVEKHIIFHCNHEGIVCGHPFETTEPHHTDIQNYKAWLTHKWTGRYSDGITTMNTDDLFFTASNCSITKAIFNTLKGFDDNLSVA